MKNLMKKWLLEYACKLRYEQVLHWFATTADQPTLEEVGVPQARSLLCTMLTIVTEADVQHFDIAISLIEQLHGLCIGDVVSHKQCVKLLTGLKVSFLVHLLKNGRAKILDKVNQYFPRSLPRQNDIDAKLHKTLEEINQETRNFFLSLIANRKMCKNYVQNCFVQMFGPSFMTKLKMLANKFVGEINSCLPLTVIEKILQSGSSSELVKALSAEKNAVVEMFLDLLHHRGTGELKDRLSQREILELLQLLQPPVDGAKVLGMLSVHWDSIISDVHSGKSMHPQRAISDTCCQDLEPSDKSNQEIVEELGNKSEHVRRDNDTERRVVTRHQKRRSDDASDMDTVSPKRPCQVADRVTMTVPYHDTMKSPDHDMTIMTSPDHDSVTMAEPDCDAITLTTPDCDTMTVTDPFHDTVTMTSRDRCSQGRIYKMKAPPPSTNSSQVNSQLVSSGTSSSDRSIMSITVSTQSESSNSRCLQAGSGSDSNPGYSLVSSQQPTQSQIPGCSTVPSPTQSQIPRLDNPCRTGKHSSVGANCSREKTMETVDEEGSQADQSHSDESQEEWSLILSQPEGSQPERSQNNVSRLQRSHLQKSQLEGLQVSQQEGSQAESAVAFVTCDCTDTSWSDPTTEPETILLPPLEQYLKDPLIKECVVKLYRSKKLDMRVRSQHVKLFS